MLKYYETEKGRAEVLGKEVLEKKINPKKVLFKYEFLKQLKMLVIWSIISAILMAVVVLIYPLVVDMLSDPQLIAQMEGLGLSVNITSLTSYITMESVECWGLFVGIYACVVAVSVFLNDAKNNTNEFMFTLAVDKRKIYFSKLKVVLCNILIMDFLLALVTFVSAIFVNNNAVLNVGNFLIFFALYVATHYILALICFSLSSIYKKRSSMFVGVFFPIFLYIVFTISTIVSAVKLLKYFSPFTILSQDVLAGGFSAINYVALTIWVVFALSMFVYSYIKFKKEDLI